MTKKLETVHDWVDEYDLKAILVDGENVEVGSDRYMEIYKRKVEISKVNGEGFKTIE